MSKDKDLSCYSGVFLFLAVLVAGVAIVWNTVNTAPYTKIVQTDSGPIIGEELIFQGMSHKAFKGIPYAAPPVGDLKFKSPEPPQKWTEVRDARAYGNICHQQKRITQDTLNMDFTTMLRILFGNVPNVIRNIIRMHTSSEDCLTLNVFTQSLGENILKPVLVWIHGGGFFSGDGTDTIFGPQYLLQQDVVVVTINYRLGPLGFLSTGTPDATGNYGMKDQVTALRWVQKNIVNFGGNPEKVTIYGESAGAVSVHLHLFSPLSKGLFHQAVLASGSALNSFALSFNQDRSNKNLARLLGASESEIEDPAKRVQFLRSVDSKEMTDLMFDAVQGEDAQNPFINPLTFGPVIEPAGTRGAFLTEHPRLLLKQGKFTKVPMIIGTTDLEGAILFGGIGKPAMPLVGSAIIEVEKNLCLVLRQSLKSGVKSKNECFKVSQHIKDMYFEGKSFNSSLLNFTHFFGDMAMVLDVHVAQREHAKHATNDTPVYNYYFTFDGMWNGLKQVFLPTPLPGAAHGDDLFYVFHPSLVSFPASSKEELTKNRMITFLTNFMKHGNPTPSISDLTPVIWEPADLKESKTMFIGDDLTMEKEFLKDRMSMWNELYKKYSGSHLFS